MVREAAKANVQKLNIKKKKYAFLKSKDEDKIIVMGLSTGGIQVLEQVIPNVLPHRYPIVIIQHLPSGFTATLARRLNRISKVKVVEVNKKTKLQKSFIYIANSREHLIVKEEKEGFFLEPFAGEKINNHIPNIDLFFESVAKVYKQNAVGILCTGMGDDGAKGLLQMRKSGAKTYAQEKKSSIVYGMPRVALEIAAAQKSLSLEEMIDIINNFS